MNIEKRLMELADSKFKEFQIKLIPNIDPDTILGVRTPAMRELAKEAFKEGNIDEFLGKLPHKYFEENMVHFFIISQIKDMDECITAVDNFLKYVDNWALCDQSSPKVFKKHHDVLEEKALEWLDSPHIYTSRFGMRVLMNEFLDKDFDVKYLELISKKAGDDYYLKMMMAWYFATALAKQYDATIPYIENRKLPVWTHNKTIQKAVESFRVSDEHKEYLRTLRIKK